MHYDVAWTSTDKLEKKIKKKKILIREELIFELQKFLDYYYIAYTFWNNYSLHDSAFFSIGSQMQF